MYTPDRLALIAKEAAKEGSVFSLDDRLGLINDAMALSKAGQAKLSSALTLIDSWRGEKECKVLRLPSSSDETAEAMDILLFFKKKDLVLQSIGNGLSSLVSIWWEHPKIVDKLNTLRRVRHDSFQHFTLSR